MKGWFKYPCFVSLIGLMPLTTFFQTNMTVDEDDIQLWNDINITVAINKKVDLYFPITSRFTRDVSRYNEGRVGAGFVVKPHKRLAITPFYVFIRARNSAGVFRTENRLHLRFVYRFPTKKFDLSHRSQLEYRIRATGNTWRYRPSITIEKALPKSVAEGLKVFATEEPFYDSGTGRFSRNRISLGMSKALGKKLSMDLYYLRQDDDSSRLQRLHIIGTGLKVKL